MRRILLITAVALIASACSRPQENVPHGVTVPAAPPNAFYVGTWAHSKADCAGAASIIHPTSLQGPGGACKFTEITPVQTGYAIAAECIWRQQTVKTTIQAALAQSAGALLLSGGPEGNIGLVACPSANPQRS